MTACPEEMVREFEDFEKTLVVILPLRLAVVYSAIEASVGFPTIEP